MGRRARWRPMLMAALPLITVAFACIVLPALSPSAGAIGPSSQLEQARLTPAGSDWAHALQVVANLKNSPPTKPLVLMFGSSIVRESIPSDTSWAAAIKRRGGPSVAAYDLGSSNQTFAQDLALIRHLPRVRTLILIGVDVARFVAPRSTPSIRLPAPKAVSGYNPHRYSSRFIKTLVQKQAMVREWLARRYPIFRRNYAYNLGVLRELVQACKDRGLHPVLLDTPRNTAVIRGAWKTAITRYMTGCKAIARELDVPFVAMVGTARFVNTDFFDLLHAVQAGRAKWQRLLSIRTVALLAKYGME